MAVTNQTKNPECNIYKQYQNTEATGGFGGIRQNLTFSVVGFFAFMTIFCLLRRRLWDFGVSAVIKRMTYFEDLVDSKLFFEPYGRKIRRPNDPVDTSLPKQKKSTTAPPETWDRFRLRWWISQRGVDKTILKDRSLLGWIGVVLSLELEDFLHAAGPDCVRYLIFQRHLIFLAFIWTIVSCGVMLPVNKYYGEIKITNATTATELFQSFTLLNLQSRPKYLFMHLGLSVALVFLTTMVLRHFSEYLVFYDDFEDDEFRSVFIRGVTRAHNARVSESLIRKHFESIYPGAEIREVMIVYKFSELFYHYRYMQAIHQGLLHYEAMGQIYGKTPRIVGCCCGICCYYKISPCRPCCSTVDALDFYEEEAERVQKLILFETTSRLKSRSLGMAIVTFENVELAFKCINDHSWPMKYFKKVPQSEHSRRLGTQDWKVSLAPSADDLQWQNINSGMTGWYIRFFLLNFLTIVIVVVYSTPVYFLQAFLSVADISTSKRNNTGDNPVKREGWVSLKSLVFDTLPALLLLAATVSIPAIVSVSDFLAGFWTRSREARSRMLKTYIFLVVMVIFLPGIGLVTVTQLKANTSDESATDFVKNIFRYDCILSPQNSEVFVNYMCTGAFIGTLAELFRFPELFVFLIQLTCLQSPGEIRTLRLQNQFEYPLGSQYAYSLMYYAMFAIFSFIFPLITPFGLLYFIMKHFVDRHNMYFAYGPCIVPKEIHGLASTLLMAGSYMAQINLVAYCIIQSYYNRFLSEEKITGQTQDATVEGEFERQKRMLIFYSVLTITVTQLPSYVIKPCRMCFPAYFSSLPSLFYTRLDDPDVVAGWHAPLRKIHYPNRLEVLADEELKGFYTKSGANRRFVPPVFQELIFLTSYTGLMNQKCLPCHDSSDSESDNGDIFADLDFDEPRPLPIPGLVALRGRKEPRRITAGTDTLV